MAKNHLVFTPVTPDDYVSTRRVPSSGGRRLIGTATVVVGLALSLGLAVSWVGLLFPVGGPRPVVLTQGERLFSPDGEGNVLSWLSATLFALLALGFILLAALTRGARRRAFVVFAIVAGAMSLDEAAQIHEYFYLIAIRLNLSSPLTWAWLMIGIPVAIGVGVVVLIAARNVPSMLRRRLIVAGALFLSGALGVEFIGGLERRLTYTTNTLLADSINIALIGVEEGLEFAGVIVACAAVVTSLRLRRQSAGLFLQLGHAFGADSTVDHETAHEGRPDAVPS